MKRKLLSPGMYWRMEGRSSTIPARCSIHRSGHLLPVRSIFWGLIPVAARRTMRMEPCVTRSLKYAVAEMPFATTYGGTGPGNTNVAWRLYSAGSETSSQRWVSIRGQSPLPIWYLRDPEISARTVTSDMPSASASPLMNASFRPFSPDSY